MQDPCHLFKCPTATESDCAVAIFEKKILKVIAATGTAAAFDNRIFIFMRQTTTSTDYFVCPSVSSRRTYI